MSTAVMVSFCQLQQESPAKKTRLHCDVDNNLITSTPSNTNSPRRTASRVGKKGSINGRKLTMLKVIELYHLTSGLFFSLRIILLLNLVFSALQKRPIMTGIRRSRTAVWRIRLQLSWPPVLPGQPCLGRSSALFLTFSHQLKVIPVISMLFHCFVHAHHLASYLFQNASFLSLFVLNCKPYRVCRIIKVMLWYVRKRFYVNFFFFVSQHLQAQTPLTRLWKPRR